MRNKKPLSEKSVKNSSQSDKSLIDSDLTSEDNQWIAESLRTHLDAQADSLDFNVTSKLSAARHRALAQEPRTITRQSNSTWFNWMPALGGTAVLAIVIFAGLRLYQVSPVPTALPGDSVASNQIPQQVLIEDLNLLSASDDIDFYQSVEFLEWMEINSG